MYVLVFFFFKQKTAYEMRISDWSSDVCSSDLVRTISLLAPAVRIDTFDKELGAAVASRGIRLLIANLTDAGERADSSCSPYGHSLLYLVSRSFEDHEETPLLGMEKHLVPALATRPWGAMVRQLPSPGRVFAEGSPATRAVTHGGMDDDAALQEAVVSFIRQKAPAG